MELCFFMTLVIPLIQFCRVISSGMVEPSCSQSSKASFWSFMRRAPWVVLPSLVFPPMLLYYYNTFSTSSISRLLTFPMARVFYHTSVLVAEVESFND